MKWEMLVRPTGLIVTQEWTKVGSSEGPPS